MIISLAISVEVKSNRLVSSVLINGRPAHETKLNGDSMARLGDMATVVFGETIDFFKWLADASSNPTQVMEILLETAMKRANEGATSFKSIQTPLDQAKPLQ